MPQFARPWNSTDEPPGLSKVPELIRVPDKDIIRGHVTCDVVWGLDTHWVNGRTRPCLKEQGDCDLCGKCPAKWYGLIQVYQPVKQKAVWVQLTPDAVSDLHLQLRDKIRLLGARIEIGRVRPTKKAPIWVRIEDGQMSAKRLPKPGNPHETLERVFGPERKDRQKV